MSDTSQETFGTRKKAMLRDIVDELHLCTLIVAYNVHFEWYNQGKTIVNQLIPKLIRQSTYAAYKLKHPDSPFKPDSLKDKLCESLKELKTRTSNEE